MMSSRLRKRIKIEQSIFLTNQKRITFKTHDADVKMSHNTNKDILRRYASIALLASKRVDCHTKKLCNIVVGKREVFLCFFS